MRKRACIVTWYKVYNYGAFLQAYGMQEILQDMGYDVYFYNYERKYLRYNKYNLHRKPFKTICRKIYKKSNNNLSYYCEKKSIFDAEIKDIFKIANRHEEFDLCVIGSDEIFNIEDGYNEFQFHPKIKAKKIISYAASFGETSLDMIQFYKLGQTITGYLSKFEKISVRDINSYKIVKNLTDIDASINIDPVLLYGFKDEIMRLNRNIVDNYILFYGYDTHIVQRDLISEIKKYAKESNLKIISVGYYHSWCDVNLNCSPFDFISLIRYANFVITTTFHGSVFAILFNKKFCVIQQNNSNKVLYLLKQFNCMSHLYDSSKLLLDYFNTEVNCQQEIERERQKSYIYLKELTY